MDVLKTIWEAPEDADAAGLKCCDCHEAITQDHTLARTIVIRRCGPERTTPPAKEIDVPWLSTRIRLYNRHAECLIESETKYVSISHIWHQGVAKLQLEHTQGKHSEERKLEGVARSCLRSRHASVKALSIQDSCLKTNPWRFDTTNSAFLSGFNPASAASSRPSRIFFSTPPSWFLTCLICSHRLSKLCARGPPRKSASEASRRSATRSGTGACGRPWSAFRANISDQCWQISKS